MQIVTFFLKKAKSTTSSNLIVHSRAQNKPFKIFNQLAPLFQHKKVVLKFCCLAFNHNLIKVYMECDYTQLNHNLLVSQKKVVTKGVIIKWVYCIYIVGFIIIIIISSTKYQRPVNMQTHPNFYLRYKCVYIYTYGLYSLITLK